MLPDSFRSTVRQAARALALAAAAGLAAWPALEVLRHGRWTELPTPAAWADAALAEFRTTTTAGESVAVLLPPLGASEEGAAWYTAQYAIAPAIVEPVRVSDCVRPELASRCTVERSRRMVALWPQREWVAAAQARMPMRAIGWSGDVLLLAVDRAGSK